MDQADFTDMGSLGRSYALNVVAQGVRKVSNSLVGWRDMDQKVSPSNQTRNVAPP